MRIRDAQSDLKRATRERERERERESEDGREGEWKGRA
jgi:hypothetical protein